MANVNVTSLLDLIITSFVLLSSIIFRISSTLIVVLPSDTSTIVLLESWSGADGFSSPGFSVGFSVGFSIGFSVGFSVGFSGFSTVLLTGL